MGKQLIFDCDGVLIDSEIIAAEVMVDMLTHHGMSITVPYYLQHCTGKTFSVLKPLLSAEFKVALPDDFVQSVTDTMEAAKLKRLEPIVGIRGLLDNLQDVPKAVASNSDLFQIRSSLEKVMLSHYFGKHIFSSEQVENPKPSPEIYLHAAHALKVSPEDCLVVEDSISGAIAAVAAGMEVIGFLAGSHIIEGHGDRLRKAGVRSVAFNTAELKQIIDQSA